MKPFQLLLAAAALSVGALAAPAAHAHGDDGYADRHPGPWLGVRIAAPAAHHPPHRVVHRHRASWCHHHRVRHVHHHHAPPRHGGHRDGRHWHRRPGA